MVAKSAFATRASVFAALGSITYGYGASIIAQTLGQPEWYKYFDLDASSAYTTYVIGTMNGLFSFGGAVGALSTAYTSEKLGRLRSIQLACIICIIGGALMTGAVGIPMFLFSRFVMGYGVGMIVCGIPLYNAELATPDHRGRTVGFHGIGAATGYTLSGFVGFGCFYAEGSSFQWRFPFAVQLVPVMILLAGSWKLPESPRWLLSKGNPTKAWATLQKLHHSEQDPEDLFAREEFNQMTQQLALEQQRREAMGVKHWWDFFKHPHFRKRLVVGIGAQVINACTGILVVNNYQVTLYQRLGVSNSISLLLIALWNFVAIGGNSASAFVILDRFGRKAFYLVGIVGCAFCLSCEAPLTKYFVEDGVKNRAGLGFGVFFLFLYVAFYSSCMDNQQYVISSESFAMESRSLGVAMSLFGQFAATALFVGVAPAAFGSIGYKFYLVFICLSFGCFAFVWFIFPETKGLSLEEIAEVYGDPVAMHITGDVRRRSSAVEAGVECKSFTAEVQKENVETVST